ncbi:sensor histidine kinase [Streptomyces sp. NPDC047046]|uniref:sensor histidine kinase n=1 Tax=Streptomyces sp. NPDC047046 TaxID=3155378 RepID=UPI0033CF67A2
MDGDAEQLRRVVDNLLANVRRHTPEGTAAHVTVRREGGSVVLAVGDEGPGIPPDAARRVFERFYRAGTGRGEGTGLGLAIVAAVAEAHDGSAACAAAPGGGTLVTVTLPAAR